MNPVTSNIIAASAGTGKTYKLASRFIALMALGYPAEKLIALTFTRAAAGEFQSNILRALADGASSDAQAQELAARIRSTLCDKRGNEVPLCPGQPEALPLNRRQFRTMLRELISKLPRLNLCTLDSFFSRLVATNCLKLGYPNVEQMSAPELARMRKNALRALLLNESYADEGLQELCTDVFGDSKKNVFSVLEANVAAYHTLYRDTKDDADSVWGNMLRFGWDDRELRELINSHLNDTPWAVRDFLEIFVREHADSIDTLANSLNSEGRFDGNVRNDCHSFTKKLRRWVGLTTEGEKKAPDVGKRLGAYLYGGKNADDASVSHLMREMRFTRDAVLRLQTVRKTTAIKKLLRFYDEHYERNVLDCGKLVFADMPRLVSDKLLNNDNPGAVSDIAYIMDGRLDHWMLDEFQDTSPEQWQALKVLLEEIRNEVAQDSVHKCATRSIFVVGDEKQSIYGWRGATPELFSYLMSGQDGWDALRYTPQNQSFRSVDAIMGAPRIEGGVRFGFVNELFQHITCLPGKQLEPFTHHTIASVNKGKAGYVRAELCKKSRSDEQEESVLERMCLRMRDILTREVGFMDKKLTAAILVRTNENVRAICRWFRLHTNLPVAPLADEKMSSTSLLGECLLCFFRWLQHPSDTSRRNMVLASPLCVLQGNESEEAAWIRWNSLLETAGYAETVLQLTQNIAVPKCNEQVKDRTVHDWLNEAHAFDATGGSLDDWLLYISNLTTKTNPPLSCIHVMTFHKSKGLGYDVVLLPFSNVASVYSGEPPFYIREYRERDRVRVTGVMLNPGVSDDKTPDSPYYKLRDEKNKELLKEAMNVLYVAVTRAKRANYLLLHANANTDSYSKIIMSALGMQAESEPQIWGTPDWANDSDIKPRETDEPEEGASLPAPTPRRRKVSPSHHMAAPNEEEFSNEGMPVALWHGEINNSAAVDFGTAVHALFEQVEWLEQGSVPPWLLAPHSSAEHAVADALRQPSVRNLFLRCTDRVVYNEQHIEAIRKADGGEEWVSGTIDRLVLTKHNGRVTAAHIIDFKTDVRSGSSPDEEDADLCRRHRSQMRTYKELISDAFPGAAVTVTIVSCPRDASPARAVPCPVV